MLASVSNDLDNRPSRYAGRGGLGAVMGVGSQIRRG